MKITKFKSKINLTNNGNLQAFFIGTGSAFSKVNFQNNVLLIKGNDHILIDCGNICPYALSTYNTPISEIKNVLIMWLWKYLLILLCNIELIMLISMAQF